MTRFFSPWLARLLPRAFRKPGAPSADGHAGGEAAVQSFHTHGHGAMAHVEMLDCESVMRQLWDYLDGELSPPRMEQIRAHIEMCKRCYPQYAFERSFLDALAARRRAHSDPERLRARLMTVLHERGLSGA